MFNSILNSNLNAVTFIICVVTAIVLGFVVALMHKKTTKANSTFVSALVILPVLVSVVIILINGNLGTGVAIAGAFSLIRFRTIPANAKEIVHVFLAMAIGLAVGTGYIAFAALFTVVACLLSYMLYRFNFGEEKGNYILKISVPEDIEYNGMFDDIFKKYLNKFSTYQVKTTNMGSIYEITYQINMKDKNQSKELIDELRIRNGNLKISLLDDSFNKGAL